MKTFEVDWDDYDAISKLGNQIKSRLGELNSRKISRRDRIRQVMDACKSIYETDISSIYQNLSLDDNKDYYVYAHLDTSRPIAIGRDGRTTFAATFGMDFIPFYIGKGIGNRYLELNRNETHRKIKQKLEALGKEIKSVKLITDLNEREALEIESKFIDIFGLITYRSGLLVNLDEGINKQIRRSMYREAYDSLIKINRML